LVLNFELKESQLIIQLAFSIYRDLNLQPARSAASNWLASNHSASTFAPQPRYTWRH